MRMSSLFSQTLRESPSEAEITSHELLLRAGFIRQLAAGIFSYLPLAQRTLTKIEDIMRQEINAIGGQEITMPVVHPADIWKETERWYQIGSELGRFKDKNDRDMVLALTSEEVVAELVRKEIRSYRQLPVLIYHIQTKWRDDPRPRAGLIRVREFTMKDSYSLDTDWEGLDRQYRQHYQAYFDIFNRCGVPSIAVESDVGMMGGTMAHEYMYLTPIGEDTLLICDSCGYSANRQIAQFEKQPLPEEKLKPIEKVATPDTKTIEELSDLLNIPQAQTSKAVFMIASIAQGNQTEQRFVFAVVRGDMDVNDTKLANAVEAKELRPATDDEIRSIGAIPGYASPRDLKGALIVVDDIIPESPNLVAGANQEGFHLRNVNYERDYKADIVTDIAVAQDGDSCIECGNPLKSVRGVEIGNIFKLGTRYSDSMDCTYLDKEGKSKPIIMGSYGIGSGRLLACIAEEYNDEFGLIWPITVAPYQVHLVTLDGKGSKKDISIKQTAEDLYKELMDAGIEVLFDDREESPGVKFNDADLIGIPIRLTISRRSLKNGGVEYKRRDMVEKSIIPQDEITGKVKQEITVLTNEIKSKVTRVPFPD